MDWSDERWVKLFTRDTTDWLTLSWQAQGLFCLVLRKVNRAGVIDLGRAGKRGLSSHIGGASAWREVEPALDELLIDGCVVIDGATLTVPNFVKAQTALQSDKARKRAERERAADVTRRDGESQDVTGCRVDVTRGHAASRDVTTRETRVEEREETEEKKTLSLAPPPASPSPVQPTLPDLDGEPTKGGDNGQPTKPTKAKRQRATKRDDAPPFAPADALAAIARGAGDRFAPGVESEWAKGHLIALRLHIRQFPDLDVWHLVGEWLAAGGERFRGTVGPSWAASTAFANAVTLARQWAEKGRGPVDARPGAIVAAEPLNDPWVAAAAKSGVRL